jgi:hypothetical protein
MITKFQIEQATRRIWHLRSILETVKSLDPGTLKQIQTIGKGLESAATLLLEAQK